MAFRAVGAPPGAGIAFGFVVGALLGPLVLIPAVMLAPLLLSMSPKGVGSKVAVASSGGGGLEERISTVFARAPYFTILDVEKGQIRIDRVVENPYAETRGGSGPAVAKMLSNMGVTTAVAGQFGPLAISSLMGKGIKIVRSSGRVKDIV